jgi:dihydroorotate dehydrogenase
MELATEVAGVRLEHPLMNAAGTCKLLEEVRALSRSATAAIMVGSITVEPRTGNSGDVYWSGPMFSLNSLGLPNRGAQYYAMVLHEMVGIAHDEGKPLFVSVAGFSANEYAGLAELALRCGADLVELNFGCPNVWAGSVQKRIVCFDPAMVYDTLTKVEEKIGAGAKVSVKISPFSDPFALVQVAEVIGMSTMVKAVTTTNTFPNAFGFNGTKSAITPGGGLAGFAGPAMKPIGLGQVRQLRAFLPERIQTIAAGGVTHGKDVQEYLDSGAVVVQVATAYLNRGAQVFSSLLGELLG